MSDKYVIEGETREVKFVEYGDSTESDPSGPARIGVQAAEGAWYWLNIGNRRARAMVLKGDGGTWVWHDGRARFLEDEQAKKRRQRKGAGLPGAVTPPMPATVVRILVERGDTVQQGQGLVVVSAMKMETTLSAPHDGRVEAINTQVGATVKPGEILVDVSKRGEES